MPRSGRSLGPTNTGKTYLAIERMCAHSSGVIGFPLRLLAREVYDRVVAIKGANQVALLTGEERIVPPKARYVLCTAESMPVPDPREPQRGDLPNDFAFAAIDEAQLGIDPERGHVFTDRMLRARGREETLILGSDTLKPLIRELLPEAEIVSRPRFSTLRYAGSAKLSRLPPRSRRRRFLRRAGLRARRDAAPLPGRRGGGDGRAVAGDPQRPGRDVPARRGRLSGRHRRHRHGPQHGRRPMSPSPASKSSTAAATAA